MQNKRLTFSIGVDLGGTNIKFGLIRSDGKILKRLTIPTLAGQGPKAVIERIIGAVYCLNRYHGVLQALGIGSAGLVDHQKGIIHFSPNLPGWKNIHLKKLIENKLKVKVFVGNDANAFALGEYRFGAGVGCSSLFGITLGTGIGGGIIYDGKLWLGINQAAGEIGHTTINAFGPKCRCGNFGCLERYAGAEYIVKRTIEKLKSQSSKRKTPNSIIMKLAKSDYRNINPEIISLAAKQGDGLAKTIIKETGFYVGAGIASIISLIDPEIIVIGGGVSGFGKLLLDSIEKTVVERIMKYPGRKVKIVISHLKDDAALLGASQFESAIGSRY